MSDTLFSPSWYRVAELTPRLRAHINIHRHVYRDRVWFVLEDQIGGRSHRFTPAAYRFIGMMDGQLTVEQMWDTLNGQIGDDAPTQDEVIRLLGQLHSADALIANSTPDSREVFRRAQRLERSKLKQKLWTPLVVRIPVFDPERFLTRTYPAVAWLFSWFGALVWLTVVITGGVFAAIHWDALTENIVDRTLAPENLFMLWLVYPAVKALHELGHGYAIKKGGGEVHEIGLMFLVLVPVPYVEASAASAFRSKYQRMLVGASGIAVELFLSAIALFVWLNVQPGIVHTLAYNVMLIGGVSTLLFNGNPLLRFDGYYVLADAVEIPNLGSRANKYLGYLGQRYLFGAKDAESPADTRGEKFWFTFYGIGAFIYRMFIMFAIILYISTKFFVIGVLLGLWAFVTMAIVPVGKSLSFVLTSQKMRRQRGRSVGVSILIFASILTLLFIIPAPHWTRAQGVTWPPEHTQIRANTSGFIVEILADDSSTVERGQPVLKARDPFSEAQLELLEANKRELEAQLLEVQSTNQVQTQIISEAIIAVNASLQLTQQEIADLTILSPRDGRLIIPASTDLPGRFARQGQVLGFVVHPDDRVVVKVVVTQDDIGHIRKRTRRINVMPSQWSGESVEAQIIREIPGGTERLPSAALGTGGGGSIVVDPRDPDARKSLERIFELDVALPSGADIGLLGTRMQVRFDHGYQPVGLQIYHSLRLLFLRTFGV